VSTAQERRNDFAIAITTEGWRARGVYRIVGRALTSVLSSTATASKPGRNDGTLTAMGTVTNKSSEKVENGVVGAFFFDEKGKLLGASYTDLVENLAPAQEKGFETISGPKVRKSSVVTTRAFASDVGY
jgi:hypothetical protein